MIISLRICSKPRTRGSPGAFSPAKSVSSQGWEGSLSELIVLEVRERSISHASKEVVAGNGPANGNDALLET